MNALKVDVAKIITVQTVVHMLTKKQGNQEMFGQDFLYLVLFWALGYVAFHLVVVQVLPVKVY